MRFCTMILPKIPLIIIIHIQCILHSGCILCRKYCCKSFIQFSFNVCLCLRREMWLHHYQKGWLVRLPSLYPSFLILMLLPTNSLPCVFFSGYIVFPTEQFAHKLYTVSVHVVRLLTWLLFGVIDYELITNDNSQTLHIWTLVYPNMLAWSQAVQIRGWTVRIRHVAYMSITCTWEIDVCMNVLITDIIMSIRRSEVLLDAVPINTCKRIGFWYTTMSHACMLPAAVAVGYSRLFTQVGKTPQHDTQRNTAIHKSCSHQQHGVSFVEATNVCGCSVN